MDDIERLAADLEHGLLEKIFDEQDADDGEAITLRLSPANAMCLFSLAINAIVISNDRDSFDTWVDFFSQTLPKFPPAMRQTVERIIHVGARLMSDDERGL